MDMDHGEAETKTKCHNGTDADKQEDQDDSVPVSESKSKEEDASKKGKRRRSTRKHRIPTSTNPTTPTPPKESNYAVVPEDFCATKGNQSAQLNEDNKSLLWFLIKQVRPGMDLSKVILPTFILEPRSFLDKMSDYFYHADYISRAVAEPDPLMRMISIVRWYFSGLYKKPKGLKKPYNPILGETFRCMWTHSNGSRTFYVAEQVGHWPPVTAIYVTNRQDGFVLSASITTKSKFYGNSTSALLGGVAQLMLLPYGETYEMTLPFLHCKGIVLGNLSMELGGHVNIVCPSTGYLAEIDFKLNGLLTRADQANEILGQIKYGTETLLSIEGRWDDKIVFRDKGSNSEHVLWEVTEEVKGTRLPRYTIPIEDQRDEESEKLWQKVSNAIIINDQDSATIEKTILEDAEPSNEGLKEWIPKHFKHDGRLWRYRYQDLSPWDAKNDIMEYEHGYIITTSRKREPIRSLVPLQTRQYDLLRYGSSDDIVPEFFQRASNRQLVDLLRHLLARQIVQSEEIAQLQEAVADIQLKLATPKQEDPFRMTSTILAVVFGVAMQLFVIMFWFSDGKLIPLPRKPF